MIIVANHTLFHSIHQLSRLLKKHADNALKPFGLYSAQWSVIYVLKTKGTLTQTELCEYLSVEAPPMTRNIQRLVKQGYVKKVQGKDKRMKKIELTEKAHQEFPKWEEAITQTNEMFLENFPESSQKQLYELISSWMAEIPSGQENNDE
ncbi:MarR family winged helix-turn-helix transcriptional regulator [Bacillus taeanensis]|uniref:MarR family transcriptional regulator n=1 Tax=Bacillus taeanensis TaxID=273032 RepID=A0A366XUM4_9BACI|nr:MarR family transcriptional regulator [Bacillus taeanensis]RBW70080.1 MarR family transcriptional regulator [Bacillus taeanensis]